MKKIKLVIIDDEPDNIEVLELLLAENEQVEITASANNVEAGIEIINRENPDLLLLDIEMPGQTGFDLLNEFDEPPFKVIFVTGYDHYAIKAIKYSALDYILKPIDKTELDAAIQRAVSRKEEDQRIAHLKKFEQTDFFDKIIIHSNSGFRSLSINEISSIESQPGNYALFFLNNGSKMLCSKPLKYYEGILPQHVFYRIHKSHIINLNYVAKFSATDNLVQLKNGKSLEVAHRRKSKFYDMMNQNFTR